MLSPSRSSSVASRTSSAFFNADLNSETTFFFSVGTTYSGSNASCTLTPSRAHGSPFIFAGISAAEAGRSRTCPMLALTSYPLGKNPRIVLALVGDSTMTNFDILLLMADGL